jgi:hypothetical protein
LGTPTQRVGRLGALSAANSKDYVLEAREQLNINKAPLEGRNLVLAPVSETALLKNELFIAAQKRGDFGSALESATLGRILGFDTYMDQNVNSIQAGNCDVSYGTVTNPLAAGSGGAQAVTVDPAHSPAVGEFCVVAGNDQPTTVSAVAVDHSTLTLDEANKYGTAAAAQYACYKSCTVSGSYAAGWVEGIVVTGFTNAPQVGQLVAFGTGAGQKIYTVIESYVSSTGAQMILVDRPLELSVNNGDLCFPGPAGALNMAFHSNAIALVTRPLAIPNNAMGVLSHVGVYNDIAMRVSMQYSIASGGTVVNLDILAGVAILDTNLCVVLQG